MNFWFLTFRGSYDRQRMFRKGMQEKKKARKTSVAKLLGQLWIWRMWAVFSWTYSLLKDLHIILGNFAALGIKGFSGGSVVKNPPASAGEAGDTGLIPGLGRSPGGGHGHLLQSSCLENSMEGGAWWATLHRVTESDTTEATEHIHTYL